MATQLASPSITRTFRPTATPTDPGLVKRQQGQNFIGYTLTSSTWTPFYCDSTFTFAENKPFGPSSAGYGGCCLGPCLLPTGCGSGTLSYSSTVLVCGPGSSCFSGLVATSLGAEFGGDLFYGCGTISQVWAAYKTTPGVSTASTSTTGPSTLTSHQTNPPTSTSGVTTTTSGTSIPIPAPSKVNNLSGAAIAGAVVGPICGVALILGLAYLYFRNRRRHKDDPPAFESYVGQPELHGTSGPMSTPSAYNGTQIAVSANYTMKPEPPPVATQPFITPQHVELGTTPRFSGMPPELQG